MANNTDIVTFEKVNEWEGIIGMKIQDKKLKGNYIEVKSLSESFELTKDPEDGTITVFKLKNIEDADSKKFIIEQIKKIRKRIKMRILLFLLMTRYLTLEKTKRITQPVDYL
jgi:SepF-like predicted cell division protein (DUF552 family)